MWQWWYYLEPTQSWSGGEIVVQVSVHSWAHLLIIRFHPFYSIKLLIKNKLIRYWTLEHTSVHRNHPKLSEVYLDILVLDYIHWCCNSRNNVHRQNNTPSSSNWYQHPQHNQTEQQGVSGTYCMILMFLVIHRRAEWYAPSRGGQRVQHHPSPWPLRSLYDQQIMYIKLTFPV